MFSFLCVFFRKKIKKVLSETRSFFLCGVYREEKKRAGRKTIKDSISNHGGHFFSSLVLHRVKTHTAITVFKKGRN